MEKQNIPSTITLRKDKVVAHHISDGSALIFGEIQVSTPEKKNKCLNKSLEEGYVIDDQGIINNYATKPDLYMANYPSPEQQKRYAFLGAGATIIVVIALITAFTVSQG